MKFTDTYVTQVDESVSVTIDGKEESVGGIRVDPTVFDNYEWDRLTEDTDCNDYRSFDLFRSGSKYRESGEYLVGMALSANETYDNALFVTIPTSSSYIPTPITELKEVTDDVISPLALYFPREGLVIVKREVGVEFDVVDIHYLINEVDGSYSSAVEEQTLQFHILTDAEVIRALPEEVNHEVFCEVV